jgi:hypothetical protein
MSKCIECDLRKIKEKENKKKMKTVRQKCDQAMSSLKMKVMDFKNNLLNATKAAEKRNSEVCNIAKSAALNIKRLIDREVSGIRNGPRWKEEISAMESSKYENIQWIHKVVEYNVMHVNWELDIIKRNMLNSVKSLVSGIMSNILSNAKAVSSRIKRHVSIINERSRYINDIICRAAERIRDNHIYLVQEKRKEIDFLRNVSNMTQSVMDLEESMSVNSGYEDMWADFILKEVKQREMLQSRFEKDNLFFIDKTTWKAILSNRITLKHEGTIITGKPYKEMKRVLKKGIKLDYPSMLLIKPFIKSSIVDVIDSTRVNWYYFSLMEFMNIFNRISKIKDWLLSLYLKSFKPIDILNIHLTSVTKQFRIKTLSSN